MKFRLVVKNVLIMKSKFLIVEPSSTSSYKPVQDLLDEGYVIDKIVPLYVSNVGNYSSTAHGRLAVYLTKAN